MGVSHQQGLSITPVERGGTAFEVTAGTVQFVGAIAQTGDMSVSGSISATKNLAITKNATVSGSISVTKNLVASANTTLTKMVIASAANVICGIRTTATAATAPFGVATTKVRTSSRIFLQPMTSGARGTSYLKTATVSTITTGVSFSIRQAAGNAACSGPVAWWIVNTTNQ